jgi:hypothetical protein
MKKQYTLLGAFGFAGLFLAFQSSTEFEIEKLKEGAHKQSIGGQTAYTGAPGEDNCTLCHVGTALDGSGQNTVTFLDGFSPVTSYVPGNSYTVSLTLTSDPAKKGFSAVALDPTTANAGDFVGDNVLGGTQDFTSATRHYVSHYDDPSSNTSANNAWLWTWNAPASDVGNVTFYVASNETNDSGTAVGDVIYLSQHVIFSTADVNEQQVADNSFKAGYSIDDNLVIIDFNMLSIGDMVFNLVDVNGKSVLTENIGVSEIGENSEKVALPNDLEAGIYIVHFFVGNTAMSSKIMVQ